MSTGSRFKASGNLGKRRKGPYVGGKKREAADYQSRYAVFWNAKHIWVYQ